MISVIEEIKERLNVADVLKQYIEVLPAGKKFKAKCPFHGDNSPSLMISTERQSWHCFGCNVGGDIFTFVTKYENIEFFEALKILAEKAGIELKRISPMEHRQFGVLYDINEEAKNFYKEKLATKTGAVNYLKERGLKGETAKEFEVGVATENWDDLIVYLVNKKFEVADVVRAGLALKNENRGNYFDRFRNRIVFPISNHSGKTVAFSGRVMPEMEANETMGKYVNSPETPIFSKSRILYGFDKAKGAIREAGQAMVVEGQMDVLMAWQDGFKNVVASGGTALTREHLTAISRLAEEVILNFDNDEAGQLAQERAIELSLKADLGVKVMFFEGVKDTADFVKNNEGKLKEVSLLAVPAMEFYFKRFLDKKAEGEVSGFELKRGVRMALAKIKKLPSAVERDFWIKKLAVKTGISEDSLKDEYKNLEFSEGKEEKKKEAEKQDGEEDIFSRVEMLSQKILSAGIYRGSFDEVKEVVFFMPDIWQKVFDILFKKEKIGSGSEIGRLVDLVHLRSGLEETDDLKELKKHLKIEYLKKKKNNWLEKIREAERGEGADEKIKEAMEGLSLVSRELNEVLE